MSFEKFDLNITWGVENQIWISAASRQGVVHSVPRTKFRGVTLQSLVGRTRIFRRYVRTAVMDPDFVEETGAFLRDLVFDIPEVATLFHRTRGVATDQGRALLVRILAAPRPIANLPWELMLDPEGGDHRHLTLAPDAHIVRLGRVRTYPVSTRLSTPPLRMLLILSSPPLDETGDKALVFDLYKEKQTLLAELNPLKEQGLLEIDVEDRPTLSNLRSHIARRQRGYHIVHYIGHAVPGGLLLENENRRDRAVLVPPDRFIVLLRQCPELSLVFFSGCETAQNLKEDSDLDDASDSGVPQTPRKNLGREEWPGSLSITELCVRDTCPMVIGMQARLPFRTERIFSPFFYKALTSGRSVADAITQARAAIRDDEYAGGGLLDWAVPCLFVGGESADPLIDSNARPRPVKFQPKEELKLDFFEGDSDIFARHVELRNTINFLSDPKKYRVLWVTGQQNVGVNQLVDRALAEFEDPILTVSVKRLLDQDPIMAISKLVVEVLTRPGFSPQRYERGWTSDEWWERVIEDLVHQPIAIILTGADLLSNNDTEALKERASALVSALRSLVVRQTTARLILTGNVENNTLFNEAGHVETEGAIPIQSIKLGPMGWPDVRDWIQQNLPILRRYDNLKPYFDGALGDNLGLWSEMAQRVADTARSADDTPDLTSFISEIEARIKKTASSAASDATSQKSAPRVVSDAASLATQLSQTPSEKNKREVVGLTVACAAPQIAGRQLEFAAAITAMAWEHDISGRVTGTGSDQSSSSIANLLPIGSVFKDGASATIFDTLAWLVEAAEAGADIILADYGSSYLATTSENALKHVGKAEEHVYRELENRGILLLSVGSNEARKISLPGWHPSFLSAGPHNDSGKISDYSWWDPKNKKPDLFALEYVRDTELQQAVTEEHRNGIGSSFASYHLLAASVLVWATDLSLTAAQVKEILISTADPMEYGKRKQGARPRKLNLKNAIERVREDIIKRSLANRRLDIQELAGASGLGVRVAARTVDKMLADGVLRRVSTSQGEGYEHVQG